MTAGLEQEKCAKCEKVVYEAEGLPAGGVKYHKKCLKCNTCQRKLDSRSFCIDEKEIYCTVCLKKNRAHTAPKLYSDTSVIQPQDEVKGCPRCSGAVFEAEKLTVKDDVYHKRCFSCHRCARALDSLIVMVSPDANIIARFATR